MAFETGTADDFNDLFNRIVSFLTTSPALVAAGREWQVLRHYKNNIKTFTTNLANTKTNTNNLNVVECLRYDVRRSNRVSEPPYSGSEDYQNCVLSTFVANSGRYIQVELIEPKEVATIRMECPSIVNPTTFSYNNFMVRTGELQYSDDGIAWSSAGVDTNIYIGRSLAVTRSYNSNGAHKFYRYLFNSTSAADSSGLLLGSFVMQDATGAPVSHYGDEIQFKAIGAAGTDEIFTSMRTIRDDAQGWYNLVLNGAIAFDANINSMFKQAGSIPEREGRFTSSMQIACPMVPCWNQPMKYWFSANGRSFKFGIKVNTKYEGGYLGFILPYAAPSQYPYPLFVGGSLQPLDLTAPYLSRDIVSYCHTCFPIGGAGVNTSNYVAWYSSTAYLRRPDGSWSGIAAREGGGGSEDFDGYEWAPSNDNLNGSSNTMWPYGMLARSSTNPFPVHESFGLDGGYVMQPVILLQTYPTAAVWGELDRIYHVSGVNKASENTMETANGDIGVVIQDVHRTGQNNYWSLVLES